MITLKISCNLQKSIFKSLKLKNFLKKSILNFQVFESNLFIVNPTPEKLSSNHDVTFCFVCFLVYAMIYKVIIHLHINMYSSQHLIIHLRRMFFSKNFHVLLPYSSIKVVPHFWAEYHFKFHQFLDNQCFGSFTNFSLMLSKVNWDFGSPPE